MKCLKMSAIAAVVAVTSMVIVGADSASATVLCQTATSPCMADYPAGVPSKHSRLKRPIQADQPKQQ